MSAAPNIAPTRIAVDRAEVERALTLLIPPGEVFELRAMHSERGFDSIQSGYFDDPATAATYVARHDSPQYVGWYVTLNPVDPALRARRSDRMAKVGKDATTKDQHIRYRRRLLIDVDPSRPTGISSSEEEHEAALALTKQIANELAAQGWPDPIVADSGNGGHLDYAINLDTDDGGIVKQTLEAAEAAWGTSIDGITLKIDGANFNPARITKLYGTPARKGDSVPGRPHRVSRIISAPSTLEPVSAEQLRMFIAANLSSTNDDTHEQQKPTGDKIDVRAKLAKWGYEVRSTSPYAGKEGGGTLYELASCPFNPEHGERGESHVIQFSSGALSAGCHHSTCKAAGWDWKWLKEKHEPGTTKRKAKGDGAVKLASKYVAQHAGHPDGVLLRRWRGDWYRWLLQRGFYAPQSDEQIKADLYRKLGLNKRGDVGEVKEALIAVDDVLIDHAELGTWLDGRSDDHDPLDIAACTNGILHLPTKSIVPATPRYFATTALGVSFESKPALPRAWLQFLKQLWPTDDESISALQEWFGYLLTPDTRQQKILLLLGPKRSGKGTIARVLSALLGAASVASPSLASLGTNFGLWPLIGKTAAVIGDARLGGRSDIAQVVERLLSISGEDLQTIDRKHREPWTGKLSARITIISNEPPRFTDASDALACRMVVLELENSFYGREDHALTDKLTAELPGILRWAIDGWARLRKRGHFVQPASSAGAIGDLIDLASPVAAWCRQSCRTDEPDAQWWLACTDAYERFKQWCDGQGVKIVATQTVFGRDVQTATGCKRTQVTRGTARVWVYRGLALH